jgi:iron complex transport system permease protein
MNHLNQSKAWLGLIILLIALAITSLTALSIGRYEIEFTQIFAILLEALGGSEQTNSIEQQVVMEIRLPRILLAGLIGAGLALAGAALQNLLRNPLADPQILGVSSGAAFGGVLAIILIAEGWPFIVGAFVFGLLSLVCSGQVFLATDLEQFAQ